MSDMQEFSAFRAEEHAEEHQHEPMAVLPSQEEKELNLKEVETALDSRTYLSGEIPQTHFVDPQALLPLNSEALVGSVNGIEKLHSDLGFLIQEEVSLIQKQQQQIHLWEDRIEKNKALIQKNQTELKNNLVKIDFDKKNRDYWWNRAESVELDYQNAAISAREQDWAWLIKKYGLKNADGTEINSRSPCVEELCNGEVNNLASEYKQAGNKYEQEKKEREAHNSRLIRENSHLLNTNEQLQGYIATVYVKQIEPLQDGVLLFKELGIKLKGLSQDSQATFGDLRAWAEPFLNDFIRTNPHVVMTAVNQFRKLTSIPLPAANS